MGFIYLFFPPGYVALWDSKTPHWPTGERVSLCLETSLSWFPPQDGSPSLTLLSLFLSFIFSPTSFWRQWAAFLGVWCPLPAFRSCFVEFAQCSNDLSINLWGRKWSPCSIPQPSWDCLHLGSEFFFLYLKQGPYEVYIFLWIKVFNTETVHGSKTNCF